MGASTVLAEKLSPDSLLQLIQDFRATIVFTAPTFYRQMAALAGKYDLSSLKKSVSAGEALPDATRQLWKQASGLEMIDGIGGTEMIHVFVSSPPDEVRRGAIGRVVPGYIAQIVDDDMNPLPNGAPPAGWPSRAPRAADTWPTSASADSCRLAGTCRATPSCRTTTAISFTRRATTT